MEIGPLKEGYSVQIPQAKSDILPALPLRMLCLAPGSSGKTTVIVTLLTDPRFYRGKFSKMYWCSPSATVDPALDVLREYVRDHLDQDTTNDPVFHDGIPVDFLESRVARAKKVTEFLKARKAKQKGFNTLFVLDDLADATTNLTAITRFVNACFVKNRHWGCSICLSTQKLKLPLITACVRVNTTCVCAFRLRNNHDLWDGLIYEYSALVSKEKLYAAYKHAVSTPYNFLLINMLAKDVNHMFYSGFTHRYIMDEERK